ncbi:MAG: ABC transporter permease [Armatimonadetes bacterium]|nr:ABC transporter permease [Armatimonadota bacterium]
MLAFTNALGERLLTFFSFFGEVYLLLVQTLAGLFRQKGIRRLTANQMAQLGIESLPIVAVTMIFSGMVLAYHASQQAGKLGIGTLVGWLVAETMCRELGPVLVSVVVAARGGSAMAAELGTMQVTEQIDALRAMATDPVEYLVAPRFLACLIMVPILVLIGDTLGVVGGYLMALTAPAINDVAYFSEIPPRLAEWTVAGGVVKSVFFGIIIALVGCHQGLFCRRASEEVGRAVTRSVVYCIMLIYAANLLLTAIVYPN